MKKSIIPAIIFTLFCSTNLIAQNVSNIPSGQDYEKALDVAKRHVENMFDLEKWGEIKLIDGEEEIYFSELNESQQGAMFLLKSADLTLQLQALSDLWKQEEAKFSSSNMRGGLTKDDVIEYNMRLTHLRKKFAVNYEKFAESFLDKTKGISSKEKEFIIQKIRETHDKFSLVERKVIE